MIERFKVPEQPENTDNWDREALDDLLAWLPVMEKLQLRPSEVAMQLESVWQQRMEDNDSQLGGLVRADTRQVLEALDVEANSLIDETATPPRESSLDKLNPAPAPAKDPIILNAATRLVKEIVNNSTRAAGVTGANTAPSVPPTSRRAAAEPFPRRRANLAHESADFDLWNAINAIREVETNVSIARNRRAGWGAQRPNDTAFRQAAINVAEVATQEAERRLASAIGERDRLQGVCWRLRSE